ncbi:hypothetical protein [Actinoplanes sp. NPDC051851]|uniref:hypothetical protein n=1 Tax=Actinoplanes sp. NPDC051851 TaxID=3154753 RepID=UPI003421BC83
MSDDPHPHDEEIPGDLVILGPEEFLAMLKERLDEGRLSRAEYETLPAEIQRSIGA